MDTQGHRGQEGTVAQGGRAGQGPSSARRATSSPETPSRGRLGFPASHLLPGDQPPTPDWALWPRSLKLGPYHRGGAEGARGREGPDGDAQATTPTPRSPLPATPEALGGRVRDLKTNLCLSPGATGRGHVRSRSSQPAGHLGVETTTHD